MQSKENILEELRLISEFVAALPRGGAPVYVVPEGYFEGLAGKVMGSVRTPNVAIPDQDETDTPNLIRDNPYAVPQGYFDGFAGLLLARIKASQQGDPREELSVLSPLLDGIDKKDPYQAPEGYFSNLTGNVLAGVQAIGFVNDELENLSPLLAGLRDKTTYQAPEGYFEGLSQSVLGKLSVRTAPMSVRTAPMSVRTAPLPVRTAPVLSIAHGPVSMKKWLKYAAAAVTTGVLLTLGWMDFHNNHTVSTTGSYELANNLSKVSDQEILNYLENQNIPLAETMANSSTATLDFSDADVKNILGNVSDDELKQYLDDNDGTKDPITN